ncbi:MAG: helix-turn-helix domain-containing protein [Oscillospiraceae bacterium]|nr:helix-turn-helix domain-containing protein [Oscillospiraceae bacterium]
MIFADKLIQLRKKSGWSQEELAEQLGVSRQSVSKWEGAQSFPDIEKIVKMSQLFGVSTDYLLKEDEEEPSYIEIDETSKVRRVSMEEAAAFLSIKEKTAKWIALATFLCIISPVCLILLGGLSEFWGGITDDAAGGIGMLVMLILVAVAVGIYISVGSKTKRFEYLETEVFETEYGVSGMVKKRCDQYADTHTRYNIIGTILEILSIAPLFVGVTVFEQNEIAVVVMLCCLFPIAGVGVVFHIMGGVNWASYEKLLQEGEYAVKNKKNKPFLGAYWAIVTAIYLTVSFTTFGWGWTWLIWVIAGVLYPALIALLKDGER